MLPTSFAQVQQKEEADEAIARMVSLKLGETAGISYSDIAARAYECGRTELAIKVQPSLSLAKICNRITNTVKSLSFSLSSWNLSLALVNRCRYS